MSGRISRSKELGSSIEFRFGSADEQLVSDVVGVSVYLFKHGGASFLLSTSRPFGEGAGICTH